MQAIYYFQAMTFDFNWGERSKRSHLANKVSSTTLPQAVSARYWRLTVYNTLYDDSIESGIAELALQVYNGQSYSSYIPLIHHTSHQRYTTQLISIYLCVMCSRNRTHLARRKSRNRTGELLKRKI